MKNSMRIVLIAWSIFALSGCTSLFSVVNDPAAPGRATATREPPLTMDPPAATETPSPMPKPTITPTRTLTPTITLTPTPEGTATWIPHTGDKVTAPILLYHHIAEGDPNNRYYISPETFEEQLKSLKEWGYTSIPISLLVNTILQGGDLPARPVVITFDDGNEDVYLNAFPIMKRYGMVGTFYIVAGWVGARDFVTTDQLKEMTAAGWEIGSHSMTHIDLTLNHDAIWDQEASSRMRLEERLGVPVVTFAYPFGKIDPTVIQKVQEYGYRAAVGLDIFSTHSWSTLYYLSRLEVRREYDLQAFARLLPWSGAPAP